MSACVAVRFVRVRSAPTPLCSDITDSEIRVISLGRPADFRRPRRQMKITTAAAMSGVKTIINPAQNMLSESTSSLISGCSIIGGGTG